MADVRLTATNPEDSSVVPVACDASGRLLLEEMAEFDGTLDGDLYVTGKGTFAGGKSIIGNDGSAQFAQGAVDIYAGGQSEFTQNVFFADDVTVGPYDDQPYTKGIRFLVSNNDVSAIIINGDGENKTAIGIYDGTNRKYICKLFHDGHVAFAGNKAGFTSDGYLWCTTRRGDTVILDSTSNGLGQWVEFTPPSTKEQIKEKLDSLREETDEMPADTQ